MCDRLYGVYGQCLAKYEVTSPRGKAGGQLACHKKEKDWSYKMAFIWRQYLISVRNIEVESTIPGTVFMRSKKAGLIFTNSSLKLYVPKNGKFYIHDFLKICLIWDPRMCKTSLILTSCYCLLELLENDSNYRQNIIFLWGQQDSIYVFKG
jgi:hypothetical protein